MGKLKLLVLLLVPLMLGLIALVAQTADAAVVTITPGTVWTDQSGNTIEAHGEGIT